MGSGGHRSSHPCAPAKRWCNMLPHWAGRPHIEPMSREMRADVKSLSEGYGGRLGQPGGRHEGGWGEGMHPPKGKSGHGDGSGLRVGVLRGSGGRLLADVLRPGPCQDLVREATTPGHRTVAQPGSTAVFGASCGGGEKIGGDGIPNQREGQPDSTGMSGVKESRHWASLQAWRGPSGDRGWALLTGVWVSFRLRAVAKWCPDVWVPDLQSQEV